MSTVYIFWDTWILLIFNGVKVATELIHSTQIYQSISSYLSFLRFRGEHKLDYSIIDMKTSKSGAHTWLERTHAQIFLPQMNGFPLPYAQNEI